MEYCETITEKIEGVGFYSPSGHFSEVHLLLEPGSPNSGIRLENKIPHGLLDKKWQKQIMTVLKSNKLLGVLTNSPLTDIKITLIGGSQQTKYSHASDYRNAALRAVRQGLMKLRARNAVKILSAFNKVELEVEERHYSQIVALIGQNRGNVLAAMDKNKKIKMNITMP